MPAWGVQTATEGASEHESERTPRCVSERAQRATHGSSVRAATKITAD